METALPNDTILGNLDTEELRMSKIHYDEKLVTELAKALARYFKEHFDITLLYGHCKTITLFGKWREKRWKFTMPI